MIYYSGRNDGQHREGVGLIVDKKTRKSVIEWEPAGSRIIRARFYSKFVKTTIIQCYAPTEQATEESKDEFYQKLQDQLSKVPKHDLLLLMGDFNAKVGTDNHGFEQHMGKQGLGTRNDNGDSSVWKMA